MTAFQKLVDPASGNELIRFLGLVNYRVLKEKY